MIYVMNLLNLVEDNLYKIEELETLEEELDDYEERLIRRSEKE